MLINTPALALGSASSLVTCWQVSPESRTQATNSEDRKEDTGLKFRPIHNCFCFYRASCFGKFCYPCSSIAW